MTLSQVIPASPYAGLTLLVEVRVDVAPMEAERPAYAYRSEPTEITDSGVPPEFLCGQKGCSRFTFVDLATGSERPLWMELAANAGTTYSVIHTVKPSITLANIARVCTGKPTTGPPLDGILSKEDVTPIGVSGYEFFEPYYEFDLDDLEQLLAELRTLVEQDEIATPEQNISAAEELVGLHEHVNPTLLAYLSGSGSLIDFTEVPIAVPDELASPSKAASFVSKGHRRVFVAKTLQRAFPGPEPLEEVTDFVAYV